MNVEERIAVQAEQFEVDLRTPFLKLGKDMRAAAKMLSCKEARWIVDQYYTMQDARIRANHQRLKMQEGGEPSQLIDWVGDTQARFESAVKTALGVFAGEYAVGQWMQAQHGIGPVLSACLLSEFDIRKAKTVGHFWRFAGLDSTCKWLGKEEARKICSQIGIGNEKTIATEQAEVLRRASGQHVEKIINAYENGFTHGTNRFKPGKEALIALLSVRPWNAFLKSIVTFRLGETMVKHSGSDKCFYGRLWRAKKDELIRDNEAGKFADFAKAELDSKCVGSKMADTKRKACWQEGKLSPQHIHERARRWMAKLFLSHLHEVMYRDYWGGEPPAPFIFEHPEIGDHRHKIEVPLYGAEFKYDGKSLRELYGEPATASA